MIARRSGQNMVEFALGLSLLMVLTMGIVDFAQAVWQFNSVAYLAREGARYGIVPSRTPAQIQSYTITRAILPGLATSNVFVDDRGTCGDVTDPIVVRVTYTYQPASVLLAVLVGSSITLQSNARMYVEAGVANVDCACGGSCT